ncbi:MAG: glycoside hydrolase family 27 protein [Edaphobacter sp.]|uniref:glycoside hydrolase family 27 protein n=1 Tax=Edaphobacter sp. TaxID=1934404 RepID=UPI00238740F3|nr:glycoside hydrolase family 27 protein [Edaphobacter sp.]MDE1176802.1 glycoside hydrolase family 27 protein [Edaphobacter sp.]
MRRCLVFTAALLLATLPAAAQKLAATPPMGWNSWNWFAGKVTDADIRKAADLIVSSGMRDAGYVYVNIDDTWEGKRDASGNITSNEKFPDMKALTAYVHSKGLKIGIYSSPGPQTCARYEGSFGHEEQDAKTYADWGFDYLKYDLCSFGKNMREAHPNDPAAQNKMMRDAYVKMHNALVKTGRPIVFSLCQYGFDQSWQWAPEVGGNLWRTTGDIQANYESMMHIALAQAGLAKFAGPGHWNDPDMLEVGNGKLSHDENITHMTMWSMLAAPLIAGNNLTQMNDDVSSILTNKEVVAVNQDKLGHEGDRVWAGEETEIWARPLADGSVAYAILNVSQDRSVMRGMKLHLKEAGFPSGTAHARDLWAHKDLGVIKDTDVFTIPKHGAVMLKLSK